MEASSCAVDQKTFRFVAVRSTFELRAHEQSRQVIN
jgi:hypothetical protein